MLYSVDYHSILGLFLKCDLFYSSVVV